MSQTRRRALHVVSLATVLCATTVGPAAAMPVAAPASTTVELSPGWLPPGFDPMNQTTDEVPHPSGTGFMTFTTSRYGDIRPDHTTGAGIVYFDVVRGGTGELASAVENAVSTTVAGRSALYVDNGTVREFRLSLADLSPGVTATVGAMGLDGAALRRVADSVRIDVVPAAPMPAVALVVPGDQGGSNTNMKGTGLYTNDWSTDGVNAQQSKFAHDVYKGNAVGVWQGILYADEAYYKDWFPYDQCWVDGWFGDITENATKWWQSALGGTAGDGIVGLNTWSAADNKLVYYNGVVTYRGRYHWLYFKRSTTSPGNYSWSWKSQPYRYTGYYTVDFAEVACAYQ